MDREPLSNPTIDEYWRRASEVIDPTPYCGPHCDSLVLHHPNECEVCGEEMWDGLHQIREEMNLRYTGKATEDDWDGKTEYEPCPAEQLRDVEKIHRWGGNRPWPEGG